MNKKNNTNNPHVSKTRSPFQYLFQDFKSHPEKRIQQVTGLYMVVDIIGHILNVGLSVFNPNLYTKNIVTFTTSLPGQLYNLILFSTYCLHGTNGLCIIVKDYQLGGTCQHLLIRFIRIAGFLTWLIGFIYLVTGYLQLGFGVPPIA